MQLTNQEITQFHQLGYVAKPAVFSQADMQPIKDAIDEMVDRKARQLHAEGRLADICADAPFETRLADIQTVDQAAAQAIVSYIWGKGGDGYSGLAMLSMLRHEALLGCITSLIGEDIVGSSVYRIRSKMPHWERGQVPWRLLFDGRRCADCTEDGCVRSSDTIHLIPARKPEPCLRLRP